MRQSHLALHYERQLSSVTTPVAGFLFIIHFAFTISFYIPQAQLFKWSTKETKTSRTIMLISLFYSSDEEKGMKMELRLIELKLSFKSLFFSSVDYRNTINIPCAKKNGQMSSKPEMKSVSENKRSSEMHHNWDWQTKHWKSLDLSQFISILSFSLCCRNVATLQFNWNSKGFHRET